MGERNPTVEQNSQFTLKTKQGQDVEVQTTLNFYISPKGKVRVNVPGGQRGAPTQTPSGANQQPATGSSLGLESGSGQGGYQGFPSDETIDNAFPRGPDCPCPKEFIPDPCKAWEDTAHFFNGLFSGQSRPSAAQNVNFAQQDEGQSDTTGERENYGGE